MGGFKQELIASQVEVGDRVRPRYRRNLKAGRIKSPIYMTRKSYFATTTIYVLTGVLVGFSIGVML